MSERRNDSYDQRPVPRPPTAPRPLGERALKVAEMELLKQPSDPEVVTAIQNNTASALSQLVQIIFKRRRLPPAAFEAFRDQLNRLVDSGDIW